MATGKRKAEGIALLSLYNDEGDDEEDEDEDEEEEGEEEENCAQRLEVEQIREVQHQELEEWKSHKDGVVHNSIMPVEVSVISSEALVLPRPDVSAQEDDGLMQNPVAKLPGNGPHSIFVDYGHDEGTYSPDAEEGEIRTTGRAVLASGAQVNNGSIQGVTPPSLVRQESKQPEDQSPFLKLEVTHQTDVITAPITDSLDQERMDFEILDKPASDTDPLADFLPPPPTTMCSEELQTKFARYIALKNTGRSFNEDLRKSKGYRNPDFLQHAVKHQEIDQIGSSFSKEIFNPRGYDPSDFYDALASEFKREQERKEQAKRQNQRVDFVHGVQAASLCVSDKMKSVVALPNEQRDQPSVGSQQLANASDVAPKAETARSNKKSKWDRVDTDAKAPALLSTVTKSAIATASTHAVLLTSNAGGGYASFVLQKRKEAEERSRH